MSSRSTVRINVTLSEDSYDTLKVQARDEGVDMSEYIRNALRVYTTLKREVAEKKRIYIGSGDKIEKELLLP